MESKPEPVNGFYILTVDQFRQAIIDASPQIHHDVELTTDLLREIVKLERAKQGLDKAETKIKLRTNQNKKEPSHPDVIGQGKIGPYFYHITGWISKQKLTLHFSPHELPRRPI